MSDAPDNIVITSVLEAVAESESIDGYTIRYWAGHAKCRIEDQQIRIAELESDHERAVAMVIQAGIATGHADTSADLMAEVLHVVKNLRAENERLRDFTDRYGGWLYDAPEPPEGEQP